MTCITASARSNDLEFQREDDHLLGLRVAGRLEEGKNALRLEVEELRDVEEDLVVGEDSDQDAERLHHLRETRREEIRCTGRWNASSRGWRSAARGDTLRRRAEGGETRQLRVLHDRLPAVLADAAEQLDAGELQLWVGESIVHIVDDAFEDLEVVMEQLAVAADQQDARDLEVGSRLEA